MSEQKPPAQPSEDQKKLDEKKSKYPPTDLSAIENGPIEKRSCTDILCLLLYAAAMVLFWYMFTMALANGEPERLIAVYDSSNKSCGIDYPDYPYLYWPVPLPDQLNRTTCVESCP